MKYNDLKIFKFSTISKKFNRIRDSFSRIYKNIKHIPKYVAGLFGFIAKSISFEITNSIKFVIKNLLKIITLIDPRRLNFKKIYIFFDIRSYDFYRVDKKINFTKYKYLPIYFVVFIIFIGFTYVAIPIFYNYDKSELEKNICKNHNIECLIRGKVNYSFYPTPRIKIKELIISDFSKKKHALITVEEAAIKLSIKNYCINRS